MSAEKRAIRDAFGAAALDYDSVAAVQRRIARALCDALPDLHKPSRILDAGSGTGFLAGQLEGRFPDARTWRLDAALGMCRSVGTNAICGDIEALPLPAHCLDLYCSSLAWQWTRPERAAREAARCLHPGGLLQVASLGPDTLHELRTAFLAIDTQPHVRSFDAPAIHRQALLAAGFRDIALTRYTEKTHAPDVISLLRELKTLGASTLDAPRRRSLLGRHALERLAAAYESFREAAGLPVSYDVILLSART